jgi:hypothetical protein
MTLALRKPMTSEVSPLVDAPLERMKAVLEQ